jgi:hypothetical protein
VESEKKNTVDSGEWVVDRRKENRVLRIENSEKRNKVDSGEWIEERE